MMEFVDILANGKLWVVVYEGDSVDILSKSFSRWLNQDFLRLFFTENLSDLEKYFRITNYY